MGVPDICSVPDAALSRFTIRLLIFEINSVLIFLSPLFVIRHSTALKYKPMKVSSFGIRNEDCVTGYVPEIAVMFAVLEPVIETQTFLSSETCQSYEYDVITLTLFGYTTIVSPSSALPVIIIEAFC
jgi:hypothetical protein